MNDSTNPETIRKQNKKKQETNEQRSKRLARERELKRQKRARETEQQHEERLQSIWEGRKRKKMTETNSDRENRKNQENQHRQAARKRTRKLKNQNVLKGRNINQQTRQDHEGREIEEAYVESDNTDSDSHPTRNSATTMSEEEITNTFINACQRDM
ncbi:unnamed protein product [Rhizophagus irregularis]|nr:unnamed protein product [Rhizophagus irregularis]